MRLLTTQYLNSPKSLLIFLVYGHFNCCFCNHGKHYFGIATPTEQRRWCHSNYHPRKLWGSLTFRKLVEAIFSATLLYASIMFVVIGATILQAVSLLGIPQSILETVRQTNLGPVAVLITVILVYLILGCFLMDFH